MIQELAYIVWIINIIIIIYLIKRYNDIMIEFTIRRFK